MGDIKLITPPDIIYDHTFSILLIYPNQSQKAEIQNILQGTDKDCNIYFYEQLNEDIQDIDWLLNLHRLCQFCFVNIDLIIPNIKLLTSYFISFPNTYWFTQGNSYLFDKISKNQIFNFDILKKNLTGDIVEI